MFSILKALNHLSLKGIIHRDIKPSNILLKKNKNDLNFTIKIIDFGLSTRQNDHFPLHRRAGTPGYIDPELLKSDCQDFAEINNSKIDIFSLGTILHFYLFDEKVFRGDSKNEILSKNIKGVVSHLSPLDMITDDIDTQAYDLMTKMLKPRQKERISIVDALSHPFFEGFNQGKKMDFSHPQLSTQSASDGDSSLSYKEVPIEPNVTGVYKYFGDTKRNLCFFFKNDIIH